MDSWSRPSKSQATPAPYYLLPGGENTPYCRICGRVIGARKTATAANSKTEVKYCSARCRGQRLGPLDRKIEAAFVGFLTDERNQRTAPGLGSKGRPRQVKGDRRILVPCDAVQSAVFGRVGGESYGADDVVDQSDQADGADDHTTDNAAATDEEIDGDRRAQLSVRSGTRIRPSQDVSEVNGSVGGEKGRAERTEESDAMLQKRLEGQKRAREREMVRSAARRGVVFGFRRNVESEAEEQASRSSKPSQQTDVRRLCEAVMNGKVVEPSFAKGNWGIRWREQ
jgi:hypothetical protein